jgi:hypothetical protein
MTFPEAADRTEGSYRLACMLSCDKDGVSLFLRNRKKETKIFHNNSTGRPTVAHGQ